MPPPDPGNNDAFAAGTGRRQDSTQLEGEQRDSTPRASGEGSMRRPAMWLVEEVSDGLRQLYALSPNGTPAVELIERTIAVWCAALMRNRRLDATRDTPRLRSAFLTIATTVDRWPLPSQLIEAMPKIVEPLALPNPNRGRSTTGDAAIAAMRSLLQSGDVASKVAQ